MRIHVLLLAACLWLPVSALRVGSGGSEQERDGLRVRRGRSAFEGAASAPGPPADTAAANEAAPAAASDITRQRDAGILRDMRAHLRRRQKREEADLIGHNRGPIKGLFYDLYDFVRGSYFANVRKSVGVALAAWLWYVFNTRTYMPPEYDD